MVLSALGLIGVTLASITLQTQPSNDSTCQNFTIIDGYGLAKSPSVIVKDVESADACCALCNSSCFSWTYHPKHTHSDKECHLVHSPGFSPHESSGAISGHRGSTPSPPPAPGPFPPLPPTPLPPALPPKPRLGFQPNIVMVGKFPGLFACVHGWDNWRLWNRVQLEAGVHIYNHICLYRTYR